MTEEDSWKGSFFTLWKVNPFVLLLVFALTYVGNQLLFQPIDLYEKVFLLGLAVFFILAAIVYEVYRICREEEPKKKLVEGDFSVEESTSSFIPILH